jgi:dTDP-4-amino-4,6-dideoxy-D-galactose acyltransferase
MYLIQRLNWDSDFLGFEVGSITISDDDPFFSIDNYNFSDYKLVYLFKPSHFHQLKINTQFLVDVKYRYRMALKSFETSFTNKYDISIFSNSTASDELIDLCISSGEYSRYKLDSNFNNSVYPSLYKLWITNALNGKKKEKVFVCNLDGFLAGLIIVSFISTIATIEILAVNEKYRGRGIAKALIDISIRESINQGCTDLYVSTQQKNLSSCALYESVGFKLDSSTDVYHFWK